MSYKEPWGSPKRYGTFRFPDLPGGYRGGSSINPRGIGLWQNPDTGEVYVEHMSDKKRFGTSRYGGKLYGMRSQTYFKYHKPEPEPDSELILPREPEAQ